MLMSRPRKPRLELVMDLPASGRRELWEGIAEALREAIVSGALTAGSNLVEADLAETFEVSRGPVRDALRELAREGLVVDLPRRGTVISTLSFTDIQEVYEVREGLEMVAVGLLIERASSTQLAQLMEFITAMESAWARKSEYAESLEADLAFHKALVALSSNGRLMATYDQMASQTMLNARTAVQLNPLLARGQKRAAHRDILKALTARDLERSRTAIAAHYVYARERLFLGYPKGGRPSIDGRA